MFIQAKKEKGREQESEKSLKSESIFFCRLELILESKKVRNNTE